MQIQHQLEICSISLCFTQIMWKAIRYSKDIGASLFDVGEIYFNCRVIFRKSVIKNSVSQNLKPAFGGQIKPIFEINLYKNLSIFRGR